MLQRSLYQAVFLLGAGLLALPVDAAAQPPATRPPASVWAPSADAPGPVAREVEQSATPLPGPAGLDAAPAPTTGRRVIASSAPPTSAPQPSSIPVPDDGLSPPKAPAAVVAPPVPEPSATVQTAGFKNDPTATGGVRVVSAGLTLGRSGAETEHPGSQVALRVVGPDEIAPGQVLTYVIVVRNVGPSAVAAVCVEDRLPAGSRLQFADPRPDDAGDKLSWNLGNLEAGGERRLKLEVLPNVAADEWLVCPVVTFGAAVGLRTRVVRPALGIDLTAPETAPRGGTLPVQLRVVSNSNAPLQHVVVRVKLPAGLEHPQGDEVQAEIGTLSPGEAKTLHLDVNAAGSGRLVAEASVKADGGYQAKSHLAVRVTEPQLTLRSEGPQQTAADQDVDLRFETTNPGNSAAAGLQLMVAVPAGLEAIAASSGGQLQAEGRRLVWPLGPLGSGETRSVVARLRPRSSGDWKLEATLSAEGPDTVRITHPIHVEPLPSGLRLDVVGRGGATIEAGSETVVEVRVRNQGAGAEKGLCLNAQLPTGAFTLLKAEGPVLYQVAGGGPAGPSKVVFESLAELPPRTDAVYRFHVRGDAAGVYRMALTLTGSDPGRKVLHADAAVRVIDQPPETRAATP